MNKKCLIAGLPSAGKSTYLAALWASEKDGNTGHKLTCVGYPSDTTYLDTLRKKWQNMETVERTTIASPAEIELTMRVNDTGEEIAVLIPDFKGEVFQQVLTNQVSKDIDKWCEQSDRILFFVRDLEIMVLQDELPSMGDDLGVDQKQDVEMEMRNIPTVIQNIMLLKFLRSKMGCCRITICVSAWDAIENVDEGDSVEDWMRKNYPFFYQYVVTHFNKALFYGVSAQGLDYKSPKLSEEELIQQSIEGRRAYVQQKGAEDHDITKPLAELLIVR
jgi:hypothetical protein